MSVKPLIVIFIVWISSINQISLHFRCGRRHAVQSEW